MVQIDRNAPALDVKDLWVELDGHTIIDNISFQVPAHTTTAIIGPNGAGKSVLVRAILQLTPKRSGDVRIFGVRHEKYSDVAPAVSYIPQHLEFDPQLPLTVSGLFSLKSPRPIGMSASEQSRMDDLLDLVGIRGHKNKKLSTLSGGQLQRVLIAYSLMDYPKLLILDEPSAGIDVQGQDTIYDLLRRIQEEERIAMILISHELDVVMEYADQVLCLNRSLLCAGVPRKVLTNEILEQMYGTGVRHYTHDHHG